MDHIKLLKRFFPLVLLLLSLKCDLELYPPENPDLPPITSEGAGTFGCIIADTVWVPCCSYYEHWANKRAKLNAWGESDSTFEIIAIQGEPVEIYFSLNRKELLLGEEVLLSKAEGTLGGYYDKTNEIAITLRDSVSHACYTATSAVIEMSRMDSVLSGTFEFTLVNDDDESDQVEVRDGRFDVKVNTPVY
ncbi:hypothetical protein [Algivirga pacifica]|uniref:Uncharacterized protein n=1 Tax=Algivirga pacifica TaxID=1162670 RepID=A0ABP9DSU4_9BACT